MFTYNDVTNYLLLVIRNFSSLDEGCAPLRLLILCFHLLLFRCPAVPMSTWTRPQDGRGGPVHYKHAAAEASYDHLLRPGDLDIWPVDLAEMPLAGLITSCRTNISVLWSFSKLTSETKVSPTEHSFSLGLTMLRLFTIEYYTPLFTIIILW